MKGTVDCSYHGTIAYRDLSSRQPTRKVPREEALKEDVAHFYNYAMHLRVYGRRSDRTTKRSGNDKAVYCVPAHFCVCACINDCR